jgi:hypothetical protein
LTTQEETEHPEQITKVVVDKTAFCGLVEVGAARKRIVSKALKEAELA